MQNRYTGDIGDFSKLGLLRALQSAGFSIGLNWYLAPDETHNSDGRHVGYLSQDKYRACDPGLWDELGAIVKRGNREVRSMEHDAVLQATFFSDCLDFRGLRKAERVELRRAWFANSLVAMAGKDIVCVDPDNARPETSHCAGRAPRPRPARTPATACSTAARSREPALP